MGRCIPPLHPFSPLPLPWGGGGESLPWWFVNGGREAFALIVRRVVERLGRPLFLLPAYTCPSVVEVLDQFGGDYAFVDLGEDLAFDEAGLAEAVAAAGGRPLALVATALFGAPIPDYKTRYPDALVIEDRAQSMIDPSSRADYQFTSLGRGKLVSVWRGGVLLSRDAGLTPLVEASPESGDLVACAVASAAQAVVSRHLWWLVERSPWNPEREGDHVAAVVVARRMSPAKARWAAAALAAFDPSRRIALADRYLRALRPERLFSLPSGVPYLRMPVRARLAGCGVSRMRDYRFTHRRAVERAGRPFPVAEELAWRCSFLPTHSLVGEAHVDEWIARLNG